MPDQEIWEECLRVIKPGGYLLVFAGSRTYHRMAVRIEDAGFEIRDQIMWIYGQGFPKSMDISKSIDKKAGVERDETGEFKTRHGGGKKSENIDQLNPDIKQTPITLPNTDEAKKWEGWGTNLKPAHEPIVMARKPLSENTIVENVLKHGTGGINIDDSRIEIDEKLDASQLRTMNRSMKTDIEGWGMNSIKSDNPQVIQPNGRFPANIIFDEEAGKLLDEQSGHLKSGFMRSGTPRKMDDSTKNTYGHWEPDFTVNDTYGDSGGASRFFYCPKVSKKERNEGLDNFPTKQSSSMPGRRNPNDMSDSKIDNDVTGRFVTNKKNIHPTVKPVDLLLYLIRLVTPKNGTTLDPFMGSGSSGKAAIRGNFDFIGIEMEQEYFDIATARIEYEKQNPYRPDIKPKNILNKVEVKNDTLDKFFE